VPVVITPPPVVPVADAPPSSAQTLPQFVPFVIAPELLRSLNALLVVTPVVPQPVVLLVVQQPELLAPPVPPALVPVAPRAPYVAPVMPPKPYRN
jgi:hypothetical protein